MLQEDLHDARTEAAYLLQFKTGYDDLQQGESWFKWKALLNLLNWNLE